LTVFSSCMLASCPTLWDATRILYGACVAHIDHQTRSCKPAEGYRAPQPSGTRAPFLGAPDFKSHPRCWCLFFLSPSISTEACVSVLFVKVSYDMASVVMFGLSDSLPLPHVTPRHPTRARARGRQARAVDKSGDPSLELYLDAAASTFLASARTAESSPA